MKNREQILAEINTLSASKGFFNVLIRLTAINLNSFVDTLATRDWRKLLNQNEIAFLFGFWLKNRNANFGGILDIPQTANYVHELMDELHLSFMKKLPEPSENVSYKEIFITSSSLQETIFYSGTGAYDYQYMDYLESKYSYDKEWLKSKKDVDIQTCIDFFTFLKSVVNYKLNFKGLPADSIEIYSIDKNCCLFKKYPAFLKVIDLFSIKDNDVLNTEFNDIGDLNVFLLKPIIDSGNKFIFPFPYLVAESIFESPFYWMLDDTGYKSKALKNRGTCAEEIVKKELWKVFPPERVYNNVFVMANKATRLTDIDICVFYEETLIIFQVKSKKLTQLSKKGNLEQIKLDFSQAVEDSFNQINKIYDPIIKNKCNLVDEQGKEVLKAESIKEIYSICIVLDNYPPLLIHSRIFYQDKDATPIAMTIFDFQILLKYLHTPALFLEYIQKRTVNSKTIYTDTELSYLKYFMTHGFEMPEDSDLLMLDGDFGQYFDKHYYMQLLSRYSRRFPDLIGNIGRNEGCFCGSGIKFKKCCAYIGFEAQ